MNVVFHLNCELNLNFLSVLLSQGVETKTETE